jgi:hypothetical protein
MQIEPYAHHHPDAFINLSLRAWTPVFKSIQQVMELYQKFYPDWRLCQQESVEDVCNAADSALTRVWAAIAGGFPMGFVAARRGRSVYGCC